MTVTNKPVAGESTKETVKTIARGMPGVSGVTVVTTLVCSFYFACEAAGASSARHSLRPLIWRRRQFIAKLAQIMRRECEPVSAKEQLVIRSTAGLTFGNQLAISTPPGTSGLSALDGNRKNDGNDTIERRSR
jgi:hypothetical protein